VNLCPATGRDLFVDQRQDVLAAALRLALRLLDRDETLGVIVCTTTGLHRLEVPL
jgi:hypothetical protein